MSKNRYKYWLIALVVGGVLFWIFNRPNNSMKVSSTDFRFSATEYNKIVLENNSGSLSLTYADRKWTIEEGSVARNSGVKLLTSSLLRLVAIAPVSMESSERIKKLIAQQGTSVKVFNESQLIKSYQLVFDSITNKSYAFTDQKSVPFSITIQGYQFDNIMPVFQTNVKYWLPNRIFNLNANTLSHIEIKYPRNSEKGFSLDIVNGDFTLSDQNGIEIQSFSTTQVNKYLSFYGVLNYESEITDSHLLKKYSDITPWAIVNIITNNAAHFEISLFRKELADGTPDYNHLFAKKNNRLYIVKYLNIDPIIQEINYFQKK